MPAAAGTEPAAAATTEPVAGPAAAPPPLAAAASCRNDDALLELLLRLQLPAPSVMPHTVPSATVLTAAEEHVNTRGVGERQADGGLPGPRGLPSSPPAVPTDERLLLRLR